MPVLRKATTEEIQENLGLVYYMKGKLFRYLPDPRLDWDELVSMGTEGLVFAIEHFDPSKGWKFSSYASVCIRGFMLRGISNTKREITRCKEKGIEVSNVSFSALEEAGWDPAYTGHENIEHDAEISIRLNQLLSTLPPRRRAIIEYMLEHPDQTHRQVGDHFGLSRSAAGLAWTDAIEAGRRMWKVPAEEVREAA